MQEREKEQALKLEMEHKMMEQQMATWQEKMAELEQEKQELQHRMKELQKEQTLKLEAEQKTMAEQIATAVAAARQESAVQQDKMVDLEREKQELHRCMKEFEKEQNLKLEAERKMMAEQMATAFAAARQEAADTQKKFHKDVGKENE